MRQIAAGYLASCDRFGLVVQADDYLGLQAQIAEAMRSFFQRHQQAGRLESTLDRLGSSSIIVSDDPNERIVIDAPWTLQFESARNRR